MFNKSNPHNCDAMKHLKRIKEIIEEYEAKDESRTDSILMLECIGTIAAHIR